MVRLKGRAHGKMRSYWSTVTNIHHKISGTNEAQVKARLAVRKLTGVKLSSFPTLKQTRKAMKIFKQRKTKRAKMYQKEVNEARKFQGRKDKMSLKDAFLLMPDYTIDGTSSEDFPTGESP